MGNLFTTFTGRINRSTYWKGVLSILAMTFFFGMLAGLIILISGGTVTEDVIDYVDTIAFFLTLFPMLAVAGKRFHDLDLSGWWSLLFLLPYVNFIAVILLGAMRGTQGDNRFGVDPNDTTVYIVKGEE
jgi:uncharacterized membrane protein YhaH (DUF805 family)